MTDHHETSRRVEVLGEGTQAQRREALVARLKRELQERGPTKSTPSLERKIAYDAARECIEIDGVEFGECGV